MKYFFDIIDNKLKLKVINKTLACKFTTYMRPVHTSNPSNQTLYRGSLDFILEFGNKEYKLHGKVKKSFKDTVFVSDIKALTQGLDLPIIGAEAEIPFSCIINHYS